MRDERRNPFRSSLVIEPLWRRCALAALPLAVYVAAFVPLFREGDTGVLALALFPVGIMGWLLGAWGGLLAGIFSIGIINFLTTTQLFNGAIDTFFGDRQLFQ